jgi:glycosidase
MHSAQQLRPAGSARDACFARSATLAIAGTLLCAVLGACVSSPQERPRTTPTVHVHPQKDWSDAIVYFAIVDRFADGDTSNDARVDRSNPGGWHGGDLAGLTAHLDEIADLGATAIWITPVVRQIDFCPIAQGPPQTHTGSFEHCAFHGYWADDFTRLDPHFGTEAELKALVDAAHARGIKILLDVVYNHVGYDSMYLKNPATAGWIRRKLTECDTDPVTCQVGGLPDLKTELPQVADYLLDAHLGLAARTGLDGFRLDTVKHVSHEFWRRHRAETRSRVSPDFFLLGEVWGGSATVLDEYFADDEMDAGFDFTFRGECSGFVEGKSRAIAYSAYLERRHKVRADHFLAQYLSSHDEPQLLYELGGDKDAFRLCVALQMTSLGIPVIYYGEEVARPGSVWPLNRTDMPWGDRRIEPGAGVARDAAMRDWYKRLIAVRRDHPALRAGTYQRLSSDGDLLVFAREDATGGDAAVVAVNRGREQASATVPAMPAWAGAAIIDALSGESARADAGTLAVSVPARSARVYVSR